MPFSPDSRTASAGASSQCRCLLELRFVAALEDVPVVYFRCHTELGAAHCALVNKTCGCCSAGTVRYRTGDEVVDTIFGKFFCFNLSDSAVDEAYAVYYGEAWSAFVESGLPRLSGEVNNRSAVDLGQKVAAARREGRP